ncbi:crotonobetainyl-CoA:carnitine CoA-transferase CaiB-like acyl-CoA transferase [Bradyrhizobium sp. JR6.1]
MNDQASARGARRSDAPSALEGIRVADFSHFIAGPMCTRFLADMGADVIKIENAASGDDLRRFEPRLAGQSVPFLWANRNKRGIALDLSRHDARQIAMDLVRSSDILVENFSTGVMERFGLGYDALKELNPQLIYCSVSAYGREGELADRLGFDSVVQAETGFMSLNGFPDGPGLRTGPAVMDIATGLSATIAALGALAARSRTGVGQKVETSLFDVGTLMLGLSGAGLSRHGKEPQPRRQRWDRYHADRSIWDGRRDTLHHLRQRQDLWPAGSGRAQPSGSGRRSTLSHQSRPDGKS